jgi:DNA processing protein
MNFPVRNRVVSGLSVGVLVVETGVTGGSMITARLAIDQNREVFVLPHPLTSTKGGGGHRLIREGTGKLVESLGDMLDELPWLTNGVRLETPQPRWKTVELSPELLQICMLLDTQGRSNIDTLQDRLQRSTPLLLTQLLTLECEGVIRQSAGKEFDLV